MFLEQMLKAESVVVQEPIVASLLTLVLVLAWLASRYLASERSIDAL